MSTSAVRARLRPPSQLRGPEFPLATTGYWGRERTDKVTVVPMFGNGANVKRSVEMLSEAVPQSQLCGRLARQVADQIRHDIGELDRQVENLTTAQKSDPDAAAAVAFRQGALRTLAGEARRWEAVALALETAPESRAANPANYAYVQLSDRSRED